MGVIHFTLGSVFYLAERAGLKSGKAAESYKSYKSYLGRSFHTYARTLYMENESQLEEELPEDLEQMLNVKQDKWPEAFPVYAWPDFLQRIINCTDSRPHQDWSNRFT